MRKKVETSRSSARNKADKVFENLFEDEIEDDVVCTWCGSENTRLASLFGGSVSELLFRCEDCKNVFGWMKWKSKEE